MTLRLPLALAAAAALAAAVATSAFAHAKISPPVALATVAHIVYVAVASSPTGARPAGVLAYRIPATCT